MMWFIHMYMQFGCLAFDEIIQVSDQPVEPSRGSVVATGSLSAVSRLAVYCQVVPTTVSPCAKASFSFVASDQYWPMYSRCFLRTPTAALNCLSSSSYGFWILSSGRCVFSHTAASAM